MTSAVWSHVDEHPMGNPGSTEAAKHSIGWLDLFDSYWWKRWDRLCRLRAAWQRERFGEV